MARRAFLAAALAAATALLNGCGEPDNSPVVVSAIGAPPQLDNPNLRPLDAPSAFLAEASAQGLVRFDATGEIEPALAQSWIVSDDGLRYTFRIRRAQCTDGSPITAEQVASRLRAAASRASRNRLKPVLGAIQEVVAMTDQVLEISLRGPRPNLLQLLAQPELAILVNRRGAGPYAPSPREDGAVQLAVPGADDEEDDEASRLPELLLRGEPAALAVARFADGDADLVTGGTAGDLPLARAARVPAAQLAFDPAAGLFGLAFSPVQEGPLADAATRRALSMAIDRDALVAGLAVPGLRP
ncbi:MAG TPA: ABC transporter substrate-binding protein, partial [Allosphingosinicella sp.]|nr:ABC transporter substrate-binding protein [Allosphingosinicella sp.]